MSIDMVVKNILGLIIPIPPYRTINTTQPLLTFMGPYSRTGAPLILLQPIPLTVIVSETMASASQHSPQVPLKIISDPGTARDLK
jgi:hypothetical protein